VKIVVTGAAGLLGSHSAIRLHALNCAAQFRGDPSQIELVPLDHAGFADHGRLRKAVAGSAAVLHFAGVNRAPDDRLEPANPAIAEALATACQATGTRPHIVYANSIHAGRDTPYGRSKARAAEVLRGISDKYTDLVLPHVFGEGARPDYNNVTATLIDRLLRGVCPPIDPDGRVSLLHAGVAADAAISCVIEGRTGEVRPTPRDVAVPDLFEMLRHFHEGYSANVYPDLSDDFAVALFNSYRAATYPGGWPRPLETRSDARGTLFEAVKGGGGGQVFFSTTRPGVTRGNHFHLSKVERFLVVEGEAVIRIRRALGDEVWSYRVSGASPAAVDMPTLHVHSIENVGERPLLTLFWTHELFDPAKPDTYAEDVLR
jgi:UDP-2-acetamido-2,6-beta-L-arabino-hexul-4-ose reductase